MNIHTCSIYIYIISHFFSSPPNTEPLGAANPGYVVFASRPRGSFFFPTRWETYRYGMICDAHHENRIDRSEFLCYILVFHLLKRQQTMFKTLRTLRFDWLVDEKVITRPWHFHCSKKWPSKVTEASNTWHFCLKENLEETTLWQPNMAGKSPNHCMEVSIAVRNIT